MVQYRLLKGEYRWLCRDCVKVEGHFHLAGMNTQCYSCGKPAFSYYEKSGSGWKPAIIQDVRTER